MNKFLQQNPLLVGALSFGLVAYLWFKYSDTTTGFKEGAATLAQGLSNPIDALMANFVEPKFANSGAQMTTGFADYVNANGGVDAYIKAHQNGTWNGSAYTGRTPPFVPTKTYDPLDVFRSL